jgi:hypothetical protein
MKKTRSKKSRDTVPLSDFYLPSLRWGGGAQNRQSAGLFSVRIGTPPPPHPPLWFRGGTRWLAREGGGGGSQFGRGVPLSEPRHFVADIVTLSKACAGILITYLQSDHCANPCRHKTICNKYILNMQSSYALNHRCALYSYIFYSISQTQPEVSTILPAIFLVFWGQIPGLQACQLLLTQSKFSS